MSNTNQSLSKLDELAKVYASNYASPHHIVFTVEGLRNLLAEANQSKEEGSFSGDGEWTLGPIGRSRSFLWQMDTPSGAGMNLWSGRLSPNNGYPEEHAIRAAVLFESAPRMLAALRKARTHLPLAAASWNEEPQYAPRVKEVLALIAEIDALLSSQSEAR